jgi:hypothetical protein
VSWIFLLVILLTVDVACMKRLEKRFRNSVMLSTNLLLKEF